MNRRRFLLSLGCARAFRAQGYSGLRIKRIAVAPIEGRFHKFVAMNSYDTAPKGHTYRNWLVRIATSEGIEGIGVASGGEPGSEFLKEARRLIGADPMAVYRVDNGRVANHAPEFTPLLARYRYLDGPLFDLIGKLTGKPCWQLIGEPARERVEVYDGTLYFSDVWFTDRGVRAVVEEAEESARKGYLGMKFKVGRGWKWMEKKQGLRRDIEVLKSVRAAVGPRIKILADANNGYRDDIEGAWRLLEETADANLYWMEEIFPENVGQYVRLRDRMARAGVKTLIADGEGADDPSEFAPYLKPRRLIDVLQGDIRRLGFLACRNMARMGEAVGAISVPHNWASQVGLFMGLHLAKAIRSIPAAEDDRSTCDVVIGEGYEFKSGCYTVSDAPGLGIHVDEEVYKRKSQPQEIVVT